jgi:YHS domain-containing protein
MKNLIMFSFILIFGMLMVFSQNSDAKLNYSGATNTGGDSMQVCIVTGEEFPEGSGVKYKYLNKEVRFCCNGCVQAFEKEPAKYIKGGLRCPVCDDDDGKEELHTTHEGVKYYFCGNGCKSKFEKDQQKYLDNYK